ncbi:4-hydroxybenzoate octaprenyltransferase [Allohahella marinimesophila]|uniref:4-hydroxybenzoate octaprenyltransferase n=1 Tax=Allohahella marinimesophila TaxID=1054972 RepID=A0ABP7PV83_9GAMM
MNRDKALAFVQLMRLDKPVGILLLLWPTLTALWLAGDGQPTLANILIFTAGVALMRSAGCVINDFADRNIDGHVARTTERPLATGRLTSYHAWACFLALIALAFLLVLLTNPATIKLAFGALGVAMLYPFMKRYTHFPQVVLGIAFSFGIPMAFTAEGVPVGETAIWLMLGNIIWTVAYDTEYAMVDRNDDLRIGVKSTAVLFAEADKMIIAALQSFCVLVWIIIGVTNALGAAYFLAVVIAATLFVYQQHLIRYRERDMCLKAFKNNNFVGLAIFAGTLVALS